jgi:imidazolonepropionase
MLLTNARIATLESDDSFGLIEDGAIVIEGELISWVGRRQDLPQAYLNHETSDLGGRLITPALVD